ncbi:unnamed protein product [Ectocarpus sp. CCAP 1310/34]|nr:unnamed protein product [Ectocarpus sp. CCAP 1310/34]
MPGMELRLDHSQRAATMSAGASAGLADASQASQASQASAGVLPLLGGKGSYPIRFKLNAAAYTREICPCDDQPVGNNGAAKVLQGVTDPKLSKAKQVHSGGKASTVDAEQALVDYINEQRKQHRGCGNREVMNKLLELKPDALGGMPANAKPEEALAFKVKFNSWYQRFRKRNGFSIRRRTSVGQKLPKGFEGMA